MKRLLALEIENYRSFYKRQKLDLGSDKDRSVTALFGVNSGGKSNTARAISLVRNILLNSAAADWILPFEPFLLKQGSDKEATYLKIFLRYERRIFTYEFGYNAEQIVFEELKEKSQNTDKMKVIFSRDQSGKLNPYAKNFGFSTALAKKTRQETLLLTKAREDNNEYANIVFDVVRSILVIMGDSTDINSIATELFKGSSIIQEKTLTMMKKCDFHIRDFEVTEIPIPKDLLDALPLSDEFKSQYATTEVTKIKTSHAVRDDERTVIDERFFDFISQESMGTKKFFEIIVPVIAVIEIGTTLYIDEFGAFLNPLLANSIVELFKSPENNKGAALILNTHNTSIMAESRLSREEIIFVEKTLGEESRITPLSEKSVREGESFEKRYRAGYYGATPHIRERG